MPRLPRSALTLALLATLAAPAGAITVNDMVAWSAPGQPLRMDVELGEVNGGDVSLRVGTAAEHARLGLTRPEWADSVRFQILKNNGKTIARALGSQPVGESFISLVVEIRSAGDARLQQLGSRPAAGAPLASPSAQPEAAKAEARPATVRREPAPDLSNQMDPSAKPFTLKAAPAATTDAAPASAAKPLPKTVVKAAPVVMAAAPAPAPAPMPAPVAAPEPVADLSVTESPVPEAGPDTAESLAQERTALEQGLEAAKAQVADIESQLQALSARERALNGEPAPEEAASVEAPAAAPADAAGTGGRPAYEVFSNVMFVLIGLILVGINLLSRLKSGGQDPLPHDVAMRAVPAAAPVTPKTLDDSDDDGIVSVKVTTRDNAAT